MRQCEGSNDGFVHELEAQDDDEGDCKCVLLIFR